MSMTNNEYSAEWELGDVISIKLDDDDDDDEPDDEIDDGAGDEDAPETS